VLGRRLAEAVRVALPECAANPPLVIPVPLHKSKERQRGFNQAELIARALLKHLPSAGWQLNTMVLRRCRETISQTGLTRLQRSLNVRGAFELRLPDEITGRDILLVDDVFTTGTTVSECARVLRRGGAARVWVATVARVLKPEASFTLREEPAGESETAHAGVRG
jgi:ComF family protein